MLVFLHAYGVLSKEAILGCFPGKFWLVGTTSALGGSVSKNAMALLDHEHNLSVSTPLAMLWPRGNCLEKILKQFSA